MWSYPLWRSSSDSLQSNRKTEEGANHPDRDAQFQYINDQVRRALTLNCVFTGHRYDLVHFPWLSTPSSVWRIIAPMISLLFCRKELRTCSSGGQIMTKQSLLQSAMTLTLILAAIRGISSQRAMVQKISSSRTWNPWIQAWWISPRILNPSYIKHAHWSGDALPLLLALALFYSFVCISL